MKSSSQLGRLLKLVPYLQQHQGVTVAQAGQEFGVSGNQILADLEVLQFCGLPEGMYDDLFDVDLEGAREDGHIFFRNADVLGRPMRIRSQEATSLLIALQAVVELTGESSAASSALAKLRDLLGEIEPAIQVEISGGEAEHRQLLQQAIEQHQLVQLNYSGAGVSPASNPIVEPVRLRIVDGFSYLDAWSRPRQAWRCYRLDRIEQLQLMAQRFTPRPDPPTDTADWFSETTSQLSLELAPRASWIAEYYPTTQVQHQEDRIQVSFPVGSTSWAVSLLLRLGEQALAVSDPAIAATTVEAAQAALANYQTR